MLVSPCLASPPANRHDPPLIERELDHLIYSISHDVRAPLRSIDGFSQALLEDYADRLDDTGRDYLHRVRASTRRINEYIDQLLSLSRLTRAPMQVERVDLSALATRLCETLAQAAPGRPVDWTVQPGLVALADRPLLADCLRRLLENAWKFSAGRAPAQIRVTASSGSPAVYQVRDNGAGFDVNLAGKLFGAFQRMHPPEAYPGVGIGLAAAQRVIHRHGGRIWAEAAPDAGAAFFFTLEAPAEPTGAPQ